MLQRLAQSWAGTRKISNNRWRWIGTILTLAAVVYLIITLARGDLKLEQIDWKTYGLVILASFGLYLISLIIQFFTWSRIISFYRKVGWQDVDIYARMILMRSLPGGAWHWVGRISMYSGSTEVPTRIVVLGNFLEWILLILMGASIFLAYTGNPILRVLAIILVISAAVGLSFAWQPPQRSWSKRLAEAGLWAFLDIVVWFAGAGIFYLFTVAVAGREPVSFPEALRIWTFSGSLLMLIIFLPSSLGVREITLVWLLQPYLATSLALLIALLIRVVFMLADIIWGLFGWMFSQIILRRTAAHTNALE